MHIYNVANQYSFEIALPEFECEYIYETSKQCIHCLVFNWQQLGYTFTVHISRLFMTEIKFVLKTTKMRTKIDGTLLENYFNQSKLLHQLICRS